MPKIIVELLAIVQLALYDVMILYKKQGFRPCFLLIFWTKIYLKNFNMKDFCVSLFVLFLSIANVFGEDNRLPNFRIDGTINADSGRIYLIFVPDYISLNNIKLVADIKKNKFVFSGYISEPQSVFIAYDSRQYLSSDFILEKGLQTVTINTDSTRKMPVVINQIMTAEYPNYLTFCKELNKKSSFYGKKRDSLDIIYNHQLPEGIKLNLINEQNQLYEEYNDVLLHYSEKNPNSYLAFWRLIRLMQWGYEPIYDSIYNTFSYKLKNGYAGKVLFQKLTDGKKLSIGQSFPSLKCKNAAGEDFTSGAFSSGEFTLVDFWYSRCSPCRKQFNDLRNLYNRFNNKGFEIIGISVDKNLDKKNWESVILEEKLNWLQYWDVDGKEAKNLSIFAYPSNFLVDKVGKIIAKDISMEELTKMLNENLK